MSSEINIQEIERFLGGEMDDAERTAFESRMAANAELAQQVEIVREMDDALEDKGALSVLEAIQGGADDFFSEDSGEKSSAKTVWMKPLRIAASIFLIAFCGLLIWSKLGDDPLTNQELYARYYEAHIVDDAKRSNDGTLTLFDRASIAYSEGNFELSETLLEEVLKDNPGENRAMYLLGHSKLNVSPPDIQGALENFENIANENKAIEANDSRWYMALIFLSQDDNINAKKWLMSLENSEDKKLKSKATELLQKLQ